MEKMTKNDYKKILDFYKMEIPSTYRALKLNAEKILAEKLCRCIKKVDIINEARSIGICTKTIFNRKGLTRGKFTCKKKRNVQFRKSKKYLKKYK
jgi:hypothetical protein